MTDDMRPRRLPGIEIRHESETSVLVDVTGAPCCRLNGTAAAVWELCDGVTTVGEMVSAIGVLVSAPHAPVREDIVRTLAEFRSAQVLAVGS